MFDAVSALGRGMGRLAPILLIAAVPVVIYLAIEDDDDTPAMQVYSDVQSCQAEYSTADCQRAFAGAQAQHDSSAPHYGSLAECEQLYGPAGCTPRGDLGSGGFFIPLMTGFLIGQALANSQVYYQPVYVNRQGYAYAGGTMIGSYSSSGGYIYASGSSGYSGVWSSGHYSVHTVSHGSSGSTMAHSSSISRGGFGSTGHSIGGSSS
jgi:uncharacterized protein YgiB involved in biofilm formation